MEREKAKAFVGGVAKNAKKMLNTATQSADQNNDGKFDFSDVSVIAKSVGTTVKKGAQAAKDGAEEKARLLELKALQPIFPHSLDDVQFLMPKFIRVTERDKKHAESEVCQGSIGYGSDTKDLHVVNIFRDSIEMFGLTFYPDSSSEFYYADPGERGCYIALDDYFNYLKIARMNELKKIAQDLGAKYFKVTYKEEKTAFSEKKGNLRINMKGLGAVHAEHGASKTEYSTIEVAAEVSFPGHAPVKPQLKYLQRDPSIQNLIAMRMDEESSILREKYIIKMSNSSGMKEADAIKIDGVLKGLKYSGNTTVASEAKNEARRYFEYDIEF